MLDRAHLIGALAVAATPLVLGSALAIDARSKSAAAREAAPRVARVAEALPFPGLAIGRGARWARFPAAVEPSAASADSPALHDPDAAGFATRPPTELWGRGAR